MYDNRLHERLHVKPFLKNPPGYFILGIGANDLTSNQTLEEIAATIINLASKVKGESYDVSISSIMLRTDDKRLHQKECEVNDRLRETCKMKNVYLIDSLKPQHLNKSKLHLNKNSYRILGTIFTREICKIVN